MKKLTQTEINTASICHKLSKLIGPVTAKSLFNGYGIFKNEHMFGIYQKKFFYIRATAQFAELLRQIGATPCPYISTTSAQYFHLPDEITEDDEKYKSYLELSIAQVKFEKSQKKRKKQSQIRDLPNLSIKHERLLARIDVKNVKEFKRRGPEKVFVQLKSIILLEGLELYWKLVGALYLKHYSLLTREEKEKHLVLLNIALAQENYPPETL